MQMCEQYKQIRCNSINNSNNNRRGNNDNKIQHKQQHNTFDTITDDIVAMQQECELRDKIIHNETTSTATLNNNNNNNNNNVESMMTFKEEPTTTAATFGAEREQTKQKCSKVKIGTTTTNWLNANKPTRKTNGKTHNKIISANSCSQRNVHGRNINHNKKSNEMKRKLSNRAFVHEQEHKLTHNDNKRNYSGGMLDDHSNTKESNHNNHYNDDNFIQQPTPSPLPIGIPVSPAHYVPSEQTTFDFQIDTVVSTDRDVYEDDGDDLDGLEQQQLPINVNDCVEYLNSDMEDLKVMIVC